mgnify:CR=1 FL=1
MSGIYISGMEMPNKTYAHCMLVKDIDGSVRLHVCKRSDMVSSDWDEYPLTTVPDHGRLIDGDKLAAGCDDPYWCRWLSEIEDAPTIIPADKEEL